MDKIVLSLLKPKFSGVREDGLAHLATSLAMMVTTQEEAQALVDKLDSTKVTDYVKEYRRGVDSEVSRSNKTYEETLKAKYDFIEKKPTPPKTEDRGGNDGGVDIATIVAESVKQAIEPLQTQIEAIKGKEIEQARFSRMEQALKDAPPVFRDFTLKNFERMKFENDEEFNTYIADTEVDLAKYKQEISHNGMRKFGTPNVGGGAVGTSEEISSATKAYIEQKTGQNGNSLGGKEI